MRNITLNIQSPRKFENQLIGFGLVRLLSPWHLRRMTISVPKGTRFRILEIRLRADTLVSQFILYFQSLKRGDVVVPQCGITREGAAGGGIGGTTGTRGRQLERGKE